VRVELRGELKGRSAYLDGLAAVRQLDALGVDRPILLAYHPVARLNPFQALLYGAAWGAGVAPLPMVSLAELDGVAGLASLGVQVVLHLHWTNTVLAGVPADGAAVATAEFLARLDRFRAAGGRLVWTVHNVLPHDSVRPADEVALQQAILDRADAVHILAADTPAAVAGYFALPPGRTFHVPHPSYVGAYETTLSREEARYQLDIDVDDFVYALVGAIKPYKGLDDLLTAFDALYAEDPRRRLVVAGPPDHEAVATAFVRRCERHPGILVRAARISATEMPVYLRAADVVVLPYRRTLNSGVLLLAYTFALPVVAPGVPGIAELLTPDTSRSFVPGDAADLARAMREVADLAGPTSAARTRAAALAIARERAPERISPAFFAALRERLDAAVGPAAVPPVAQAAPAVPAVPLHPAAGNVGPGSGGAPG
jgi:glycosyltransferase involved in cell wall biosynthesis